ncbi:hypothetical protein LSTR_LSTR001502 [Laodelphax striatellus]|uniref:Major facilitator superfamily (MFS) profile domain-containing protein n=1 Tax=Laodelphax striatellus TaxID=195883 RepID=A0A482XAI6_LAOST|nr:hypothetical protein LSTR_LSTR001502 [Laodelphax striatellus]
MYSKSNDASYTFEEALQIAGQGKFQRKVTLVGGLIAMASFISVGTVSFIMTAAQCDLRMDSIQKGTLISAGFIGMILSCHMWGFLSDTKGRRFILLRCLTMDGIMYILSSFMPSYKLLLIMRFIHGFVICGSIVPCYPYIGEFHTNQYRSKALLIVSLIACMSNFYQPGLSILVNLSPWRIELLPSLVYKPWRLFYALSGIPSLISAALLFTLPESPMFLLANGDQQTAIKILSNIHNINSSGNKNKQEFLVKNLIIEGNSVVNKVNNSNKNKTSMFFHSIWEQTVPLTRKPYRLKIILITSLQFLLFLSNNCIFLWVPETINRIGIYHRDQDAKSITFCEIVQTFDYKNTSTDDNFGRFGNSTNTSLPSRYDEAATICSEEKINSAVYWTVSVSGSMIMICLVMIHFAARMMGKKLIVGTTIFCALISISLLLFTGNPYLIISEMCFFMMVSAAATQVVLYTVVDLFPTKIRSMAVCLAIMCSRFGSITSNQVSGALIDNYCSSILIIMLACLSVCLVIT